MNYTVNVNLTCDVQSLKDAHDTLARLAISLPELVKVLSFSVWSPDSAAESQAAALQPAPCGQDERWLAELQEMARGIGSGHTRRTKPRPH